MISERHPAGPSYEITIPGSLGPALVAGFVRMGVTRVTTSSSFLLTTPTPLDLSDVIAIVNRLGLLLIEIRQAPEGALQAEIVR